MKRERADWTDHAIALIIIIVLWLAVDAILDTAKAHYETEQERPVAKPWTPPAIPQCDKELWDRIREGCDG